MSRLPHVTISPTALPQVIMESRYASRKLCSPLCPLPVSTLRMKSLSSFSAFLSPHRASKPPVSLMIFIIAASTTGTASRMVR